MGGAPSHSHTGPIRLLLLCANWSGGHEGWVGKARHSSAAPSSRANRGEGAKGGWVPIQGLRAAPCSHAAIAHNGGREKKGGQHPSYSHTKGGCAPLLLCVAIRSLVPTSLYMRSGARMVAHTPFLCPHFCTKGGEGRDEEEWVGRAKCRKEGSKSQKRGEDRGGRDWGTTCLWGGQCSIDSPKRCTHS